MIGTFATGLNYNADVPALSVTPSLQYIHHSGGNAANGDATVLGLGITANL